MLEETARDTDAEVKDQSKVARIIAVVLAVVIPASAVFGYLALGRYNAMDPAFLEAVQNQQRQTQGHSQSDMMAAIERLQNRLKETPDDAQTWYMLARTLSNVGRFAEALDAFREVDRLVPNNADIIADMADMTAAANNKVITDEARALLQRALKIDPGQWKALALLAIDAWDHEKCAEAAAYWEKLLVVLPEDFGDAQQIRNNIDEARRLAGMDPAARQAEAEAFKGESVPTVQAAEPSFVSGRVTLDKAHADKVKPEDTVFIYARPTTGSKMPVAFMRITAKELPFEFKLTSDMTMAMGATTLGRRQGRDRRSPNLPHRQLHAAGGRPRGRDFRSRPDGHRRHRPRHRHRPLTFDSLRKGRRVRLNDGGLCVSGVFPHVRASTSSYN